MVMLDKTYIYAGQDLHQKHIKDYISISDKQDSISYKTAPLIIFVHELFHMKEFITDNEELSWKGNIASSFYKKCQVPAIFNNSGGEGYLEKYEKH